MSPVNAAPPPRALAVGPSTTVHEWGASDSATCAAEHARAGSLELAAEGYVEAANRAAKIGRYARAVELLERALALLDDAPPAASHRSIRIAALMMLGRTKWLAAGSNTEKYTLPSALAALESAASLLLPGEHVALRAELAQLTAQVYYDIGGREQLARALALLRQARRDLLDGGRPLEAARLLSDEAAVHVRRGDLALARRLLLRSRKTFARYADASPVARREVARSEHTMARLALHASTDDRFELELALQRALSAEDGYRLIGDEREQARVWETQARLLHRLGRSERAMERLETAIPRQSQLGDAVGMARSTAALAELIADGGSLRDAFTLLRASVALNLRKGSLAGLAYNKKGLDELRARVRKQDRDSLAPTIDRLRSRIDSASP